MKARWKLASLMGGAVMIATAIGLTAGVAPASAAPKQVGATLHIVQDVQHSNNWRLTSVGVYPMSQADAQGFLNNMNNGKCRGALYYHVYGDDGSPQHIFSTRPFYSAHADAEGFLRATPQGLEYRREITLRKSKLNEDDGVFDKTDEIYTQVNFLDSDCKSRFHTSQVISRIL